MSRIVGILAGASRRVPDISKIQRLTGYQPSVQLDEILERVIADFRNSEETEFATAEKTA